MCIYFSRCSENSAFDNSHAQLKQTKNKMQTKRPDWKDGIMMKAVRGEPVDKTPIWMMRQAGRYMQEYRTVREKVSFLELCKNPALCAEVMITAVDKLGVDAAIIFSDLLVILEPMGLPVEFTKGDGPSIGYPIREPEDVSRLRELEDVSSLEYVFETVRKTREGLPSNLPLIGFAGAPFTLLGYAIEGGGSRDFRTTKTFMRSHPQVWGELMSKFSRSIARYLNSQIAAGAQIVQLFDSWVGTLGLEDYRKYVLPYVKMLIDMIDPNTPLIHFGTGNPALLPAMREAGGRVIGVDWRIPMAQAWKNIGYDKSVQGNLDPSVLLSSPDVIQKEARNLIDSLDNRPGFIFNLGHGILPQTPVENAVSLVEAVHG